MVVGVFWDEDNGTTNIGSASYRSDDDDSGIINSGSAYVLKLAGDANWYEMQKLTASGPATSDPFGYSVAISDQCVIVIGVPNDDDGTKTFLDKNFVICYCISIIQY